MRTKQIAGCLLYLFCSQHILGIAAAVEGHRIVKRQTSCSLNPSANDQLNSCVQRIRDAMPDSVEVAPQRVEEYELVNGRSSGFKDFHCTWRCSCGRDMVRLFITVSFVRILLTFVMNLVDDLLGGLLGGLGSSLARVVGNVVNLLVRVLALDVRIEITVVQNFVNGANCVVESYRVSRVTNIMLLGLQLRPLVRVLSPLLAPVVDLVLQIILNDRIKEIISREFEGVRFDRTGVTCSQN